MLGWFTWLEIAKLALGICCTLNSKQSKSAIQRATDLKDFKTVSFGSLMV